MDLLTANDRPGAYPDSYYAAALGAPPTRRAELASSEQADVAVVGGGFTGLSTALHLARRGYDVALLEAQRVGFGASGRNGGQVGTGQRKDQDALERMVGREDARALWQMGLDAVALVRELASDREVGVPFHDGIIHADHKRSYVRESHAYAERLARDYGYDKLTALDRAGIREILASDAYFGGVLDTGAGHIDPLAFAMGLARLAEAAGVRIYEGSRVRRIERGSELRFVTDKGEIRSPWGVLGCNGYLGALVPEVARRAMPINNFVAATEPMAPEMQEALIADNRAVADSRFVVNYFRFSDDHRLLFGGGETYSYRFPQDIAAMVRKRLQGVFPQLQDVEIDYAWGGTLAITQSRLPHFARVAPNLISLSGYSGHGVALATLAGQIAAETVAGQAERFDLMARVPTPAFPGGAALRWPLLVLGMTWFSLRDRM